MTPTYQAPRRITLLFLLVSLVAGEALAQQAATASGREATQVSRRGEVDAVADRDARTLIAFLSGKQPSHSAGLAAIRAAKRLGNLHLASIAERLNQSPSGSLRLTAMAAMGKQNLPGTVGVLGELLADPKTDAEMRLAVVSALAASQGEAASTHLLTVLDDPDPRVQRIALAAFRAGRAAPDRQACVDIMKREQPAAKVQLLKICVRFDPIVQTELVALGVRDTDRTVREAALTINWWLDGRAEYNHADLVQAANDDDAAIRIAAAIAMLTTDWDQPPATLQRLLTDQDVAVRSGIAASLRGATHPQIMTVVDTLRRDADLQVRLAVVRSLASMDQPDVEKLLLVDVRDPNERIRAAAVRSLARRDSPHLQDAFEAVFDTAGNGTKLELLYCVNKLEPQQAWEVLSEMLSARQVASRRAVVRHLPSFSRALQYRCAEALYDDPDFAIRLALAQRLATHATEPEAHALLQKMVGDPNEVIDLIARSAVRNHVPKGRL